MSNVLVFSDLHLPWVNKKAVVNLYRVAERLKPSVIVLAGDALDMFSFSRFPKPIIITPTQELNDAMEMLREIWGKLRMIVPNAKCIQLSGNHESRIEKTILTKCPELHGLLDIRSFLQVEGVELHASEKHELTIDGVLYCHGFLTGMGRHSDYFNRSVVKGHSHDSYIVYKSMNGETRWEAGVGTMAALDSLPLKYRPTKSFKCTCSCLSVDEHGPRIILL